MNFITILKLPFCYKAINDAHSIIFGRLYLNNNMGETMKNIYVLIFIVCMFAASNAQAAFVWNWTIERGNVNEISGTLMTTEGYEAGSKTIESWTVIDNGIFSDLFVGTYTPVGVSNFSWDGNFVSTYSFDVDGGSRSVVRCNFGIDCNINDESSNRVFLNDSFEASPVPIPAAAWLFMSGLLGLVYKGRRVRQAAA